MTPLLLSRPQGGAGAADRRADRRPGLQLSAGGHPGPAEDPGAAQFVAKRGGESGLTPASSTPPKVGHHTAVAGLHTPPPPPTKGKLRLL